MLIAGIKIIITTPLDVRITFTAGAALAFGLCADIMPEAYSQVHPWLRPVLSSSLTLATVMAIIHNLIFHLGENKG